MSRERFVLVALAGLPGTGKSTLARRLAAELGALLLDKDAVRAALFGPDHVTYTSEQDDFVMRVIHQAVEHARESGLASCAIVDGRTYSRRDQVDVLRELAERACLDLCWIECTCEPAVARERLRRACAEGSHLAADRGPELYDRLAGRAEPLVVSRLTLDSTSEPPDALAQRALDYMRKRSSIRDR
jgi:predicted kinase